MSYTVKKVAQLSGVSVRTIHWYDEIGLLKPAYYSSSGYRYYLNKHLDNPIAVCSYLQIKNILTKTYMTHTRRGKT